MDRMEGDAARLAVWSPPMYSSSRTLDYLGRTNEILQAGSKPDVKLGHEHSSDIRMFVHDGLTGYNTATF